MNLIQKHEFAMRRSLASKASLSGAIDLQASLSKSVKIGDSNNVILVVLLGPKSHFRPSKVSRICGDIGIFESTSK